MTQAITQTRQVKGGSYWLLIDTNGDEWATEADDCYTIEDEFFKDARESNFVLAKEVKQNVYDYWLGYFYYNDDEVFDLDTTCPDMFNSREHLESYAERNVHGGHYVWGRIEHIVNGVVVETEDEEIFE